VKKNEWYFKKLISETLARFDKEGINEITMEDLDISKTSASFVKSEEFQMKYSRLIRMLRLSKIKEWFKRQAENYGIKVHLTNPAYTSQECNKCHFISKDNRNGAKFLCLECGLQSHSDSNSPITILNRTTSNVLRSLLHNYDEDGQLISKKMNHKNIKNIIYLAYN
jgi:putative transposase